MNRIHNPPSAETNRRIRETEICELFSTRLPSGRLNACFESDAELIRISGQQVLFTTDEFSAEDLFREEDPYLLGWNIAAGAISDILACGGVPRHYAHALTVSPLWDRAFLERLSDGIGGVLEASGARFIGGDCGCSPTWRCTASVLGTLEGTPVTRRGAKPGDGIYLTGRLGAGNLEAALRLSQSAQSASFARTVKTQFPVRLKASRLLRSFASAAIDTSDGAWRSLNHLANLNGCGYAVDAVPYLEAGEGFCETVGWPKTLLFLGECGEYELLFTVRPERESPLLEAARSSGCDLFRIGQMTPQGRTLLEGERVLDLSTLQVEAREFASPQAYLNHLATWLGRIA